MEDYNDINEKNSGELSFIDTDESTDRKCPNCGATVTFNVETHSMQCEFCGYTKELAQGAGNDEIKELDFGSAELDENCDWGNEKILVSCKNCGGETIVDSVVVSTSCPFCGSTNVASSEMLKKTMLPGGIVPFAINEKMARDCVSRYVKGKVLCPSVIKNNINAMSFRGIYLPFWTFDSSTSSTYKARLGYRHSNGKNTYYTWKKNNGVYDLFIDDQMICSSERARRASIEKVAAFDFSKMSTYNAELLAGFAAERYSVSLKDGFVLAKASMDKVIRKKLTRKLRSSYRADRVEFTELQTHHANVTYKYVLAPIWVVAFKYQNSVYDLAVNGQTGKVEGKTPYNIGVIVAIIGAIVGLYLLFQVLPLCFAFI
ncbi:MAG TPA: hypothetical protein PLM10_07040 [Saccharofermentans sp.]|jgi:predicted RNA-binding Zn-ribbon protein involved in translation (DUF1610 family)|nr:hypothetical protein [Saccharofermentans sp.]HPE28594.1 hypothetical protein [Saccharofermentans sp.]HPQ31611.1 hypothetical protein [Saccharofermentans sp.]HRV50384.1 hypothetical protein [Saccharofermentans sp.]